MDIRVQGRAFVDSKGRTRIFNGFNFDDKAGGATKFCHDLDDAFFVAYAARGFTVLRLGVTWENLEPEPGQYNESYLRSVDAIFEAAARHGVYILLDMHQDLYSGFETRIGDGAPAWATLSDGYKQRKPIYTWGEGYLFGKAVHRSFDHFWANDEVHGRGLQDHFAALWAMLARRYGNKPALLGFDLLNEPFPGSLGGAMFRKLIARVAVILLRKGAKELRSFAGAVLRDGEQGIMNSITPELTAEAVGASREICRRFDQELYSPFLNKVSEAIRRETPNGIITIGQSILGNAGAVQSTPPIRVDGRREPNQCYAPHAYDFTVDTPLYKYASDDRVGFFFSEAARNQERLDMPVIVGEWGAAASEDRGWFPHARFLLDFFDRHQWGQTYWAYQKGDLDAALMEVLCRTCPQAVAGRIDYYLTDRYNNVFSLGFTQTEDCAAPTLIYIHKPHRAIEADGSYRLTPLPNGAALMELQTEPGEHRVQIWF